jgi:hypothetical protein
MTGKRPVREALSQGNRHDEIRVTSGVRVLGRRRKRG